MLRMAGYGIALTGDARDANVVAQAQAKAKAAGVLIFASTMVAVRKAAKGGR